jgi:hypothetical protein
VDSCDIFFISEVNENYHRQGLSLSGALISPKLLPTQTSRMINPAPKAILPTPNVINKGFVYKKTAYNPNALIGIDSVHGDILIEKDEYPIIRGGWYDRNGLYYSDNITSGGLTSINITFDGVTLNTAGVSQT